MPPVASAAISPTTSWRNKQEDGKWVARIKDPLAEYETYAKAFSAVGLKVRLQLVPVSPSQAEIWP
jgi:hypothetical protein